MRMRTILKSLLAAYLMTGGCLMILAFLLYKLNLGETPVAVGITMVYMLSCFLGGFLAGKKLRKDKYIWGILVGIVYYILLILASFLAKGKWNLNEVHAVTTFCICLGSGTLGGMLA